MEAYSKELKFLEKHPKNMTAAEKNELLRNIKMKMLDMMLALESLAEDGEKGGKKSEPTGKPIDTIKKLNKDTQKQIDELKNSLGKQSAQGFAYDPLVYPEKFKKLHDSLDEIITIAVDMCMMPRFFQVLSPLLLDG